MLWISAAEMNTGPHCLHVSDFLSMVGPIVAQFEHSLALSVS